MNRGWLVVLALAGLVAAGCGGGASAAASATGSASPGRSAFRNGAAGQLVQINGEALILTAATGDVTVNITSATIFTRTSNAVLADIVPGLCIAATGQKDSAGLLTATTVRLSPRSATGCTAGQFRLGTLTGASPRPAPSGGEAAPFVRGQVTAVTGTSVKVLSADPAVTESIIVPTTAAITESSMVTAADLQTGECLRAAGAKNSSGAVQATVVIISPPGASGVCATGFGGRFGGQGSAGQGSAPG